MCNRNPSATSGDTHKYSIFTYLYSVLTEPTRITVINELRVRTGLSRKRRGWMAHWETPTWIHAPNISLESIPSCQEEANRSTTDGWSPRLGSRKTINNAIVETLICGVRHSWTTFSQPIRYNPTNLQHSSSLPPIWACLVHPTTLDEWRGGSAPDSRRLNRHVGCFVCIVWLSDFRSSWSARLFNHLLVGWVSDPQSNDPNSEHINKQRDNDGI